MTLGTLVNALTCFDYLSDLQGLRGIYRAAKPRIHPELIRVRELPDSARQYLCTFRQIIDVINSQQTEPYIRPSIVLS